MTAAQVDDAACQAAYEAIKARTRTWCEQRGHPWSTYNPWLHRTWCRCGQRQAAGRRPVDLAAIAELHRHDKEDSR